MHLNKIREKKAKAEKQIEKIISDLQTETGCNVESVSFGQGVYTEMSGFQVTFNTAVSLEMKV